MSKKYKRVVLIGRFEPVHNGHLANFLQALDIADKIIIFVGSSFQPQTPKNPFTFDERKDMIEESIFEGLGQYSSRGRDVSIYPLRDFKYSNNNWISEVQRLVKLDSPDISDSDIAIMGYDKDETSWYNHAFPEWSFVQLRGFVEFGTNPIDATKIRELYFEGHLDYLRGTVPPYVFEVLQSWKKSDAYDMVVEEHEFYKNYDASDFPRIEQTVDAVVIQGGHILLIQRGGSPGKGLWALPGGFLNPRERLFDGMIRELLEETKIKVPEIVLRKAVTYQERFDHPDRDLRGRVITEAFLIVLDGGDGKLPRVKGHDDAKKAKWFKLSEIKEEVMYGDHKHIIDTLVARAKS